MQQAVWRRRGVVSCDTLQVRYNQLKIMWVLTNSVNTFFSVTLNNSK